jgi:hypothetical protein
MQRCYQTGYIGRVNAAARFAHHLSRDALVRLVRRRDAAVAELAATLGARFAGDLAGLLNRLSDADLRACLAAERLDAPDADDTGALRERLWRHGARLEAGGDAHLGSALQPVPMLVAGRLRHLAPPRGPHPPASCWPRPIPGPAPAVPPDDEPDTLDELLAAADRALGVRLGARGRDKGAWGARAAQLLGVIERGADEPDWRGDVEIKTVPIAADRRGCWRVTEDPAVSMVDASPLAKLQRVLWLARASLPGGDATFVAWYLLDWDDVVSRLVARDLHTRPKGGAGSTGRGWYLHKRFFADAGLLAALNGAA